MTELLLVSIVGLINVLVCAPQEGTNPNVSVSIDQFTRAAIQETTLRVLWSIPDVRELDKVFQTDAELVSSIESLKDSFEEQVSQLDARIPRDRIQYSGLKKDLSNDLKKSVGLEVFDKALVLAFYLNSGNSEKLSLPVRLANIAEIEDHELENRTLKSIQDFNSANATEIRLGLKTVVDVLDDKAKQKFKAILAVGPIDVLKGITKGSSKAEIHSAIVESMLLTGKVPSDELVDFQQAAQKQIVFRMCQDTELREISDLERRAEELGPDSINVSLADLATERQSVIKRLMDKYQGEIEDSLLPHQAEALDFATLFYYAKLRSDLPFDWPKILADDLELDQNCRNSIELLADRIRRDLVARQSENTSAFYNRIVKGLPEKLKDLLSLLETYAAYSLTFEDLEELPSLKKSTLFGSA